MGACAGARDMITSNLSVAAEDSRSVTLEMDWTWTLNAIPLTGTATYVIDVDGNWSAEASTTNGGNVDISGTMEIGDTHVNESLPWHVTETLSASSFAFSIPSDGTFSTIAFEQTLVSPPADRIGADELNNRYFEVPLSLGANGTASASWTARIWQDP